MKNKLLDGLQRLTTIVEFVSNPLLFKYNETIVSRLEENIIND